MQSLSLHQPEDSTAWDSGPGAHSTAASSHEHQHSQYIDHNLHSAYEPHRDSTAHPASVWQNQEYEYYDPTAYGAYGEYCAEESYGQEAGDDWDQLGFAAQPESLQQAGSTPASDKLTTPRRKPSEQALCSQFQVSGDCPHGAQCHMAHGELCQVSFALLGWTAVSLSIDLLSKDDYTCLPSL